MHTVLPVVSKGGTNMDRVPTGYGCHSSKGPRAPQRKGMRHGGSTQAGNSNIHHHGVHSSLSHIETGKAQEGASRERGSSQQGRRRNREERRIGKGRGRDQFTEIAKSTNCT